MARKATTEEKGILDLSHKVAPVTGGGSGLGRVFGEAMAEFAADVACCDHQQGQSARNR
jgi:NAD(P)-dependent dehydrogenase (short-subunit alcohol dehydrogenase family)